MGDIFTTELISHLVIFMVVLLMAISCHEAAHAWMSNKFGDDTALQLGRVTINPLPHIDPIGTLLIPVASFIFGAIGGALGAIPLIGWGKPTPVTPGNWTNYKKANFWVSIAGVLANMILLVIGIALAKILMTQGISANEFFSKTSNPLVIFVNNLMILNLSLAIFNLLPIPPLDGGKILENFVPESFKPILAMVEQFGFMILILFVYMGIFGVIIRPFFIGLLYLLHSI